MSIASAAQTPAPAPAGQEIKGQSPDRGRPPRHDAPATLPVLAARYGAGLEGGSVSLRVANYGAEDVEAAVTVGLPDGSEITAFVELPAGGEAEERVTVPPTVPGGVAWARVIDPALEADNTRFFHLPRVGASPAASTSSAVGSRNREKLASAPLDAVIATRTTSHTA